MLSSLHSLGYHPGSPAVKANKYHILDDKKTVFRLTHFSLTKLSKSIQTIKNNETRFVILQKSLVKTTDKLNKASVKFELDHARGSLAAILNVLSDCKLNLTKIQSLPKIETPWVYSFFIDITFDNYKHYLKAKSIMSIMAKDFKVLGEYENRKK